jgi:protein phosphatase
MRAVACTVPGRVRPANEDSVFAVQETGLLIVADGMGGHAAGEVASNLAIQIITDCLRQPLPFGERPPEIAASLLLEAIEQANLAIRVRASQDPLLHGMGTTLVAAICRAESISLAHLGDSRAYLIRGGQIRQATQDHSLVAQMVNAGEITPEEARKHHLRNLITRSLGSAASAQPDIQLLEWLPGDYLLMCSDGLTNMVEDEEIARSFGAGGAGLTQACEQLIALANSRGGNDNISVVVGWNG